MSKNKSIDGLTVRDAKNPTPEIKKPAKPTPKPTKAKLSATKNPVKNIDLWKKLIEVMKPHKIEFIWVKGHNGHDYNERCDRLATDFAESFL